MKKLILFIFAAFALLSNVACGMDSQEPTKNKFKEPFYVLRLVYLISGLPDIELNDATSGKVFLRKDFPDIFKRAWEEFKAKNENYDDKTEYIEMMRESYTERAAEEIIRFHESYPSHEDLISYALAFKQAILILMKEIPSNPSFLEVLLKH